MTAIPDKVMQDLRALVDDYRDRCLWFLRPGYYPKDTEEALRTLSQIERHGDVEGFKRAGELRQCLSQTTSAPSAV